MIICSNCQHQNVSGAVFCAECGAQLDGVETLTTHNISDEEIAEELSQKEPRPEPPSSPTNSWISLHLMDSGKILPLATRNEFTLGRLSEGQPIMPDIDLTPLSGICFWCIPFTCRGQTGCKSYFRYGPRVIQWYLFEWTPSQPAHGRGS